MRIDPVRSPLSWTAIFFGAVLTLLTAAVLDILGLGLGSSLLDPDQEIGKNLARVGGLRSLLLSISAAFILFVGGLVGAAVSYSYGHQCAAISSLIVWIMATIIVLSVFVAAAT